MNTENNNKAEMDALVEKAAEELRAEVEKLYPDIFGLLIERGQELKPNPLAFTIAVGEALISFMKVLNDPVAAVSISAAISTVSSEIALKRATEAGAKPEAA